MRQYKFPFFQWFYFLREFQLITFAFNDSFLLSNQNTNN